MISRRTFLKSAAAAVACAGATVSYAVFEQWQRLTVREWTVATPAWPPDAPPLRIAIIADFHAVKPWMSVARIAGIADTAMQLRPDLIALLGDYMPGVSENWATGFPAVDEWTGALTRLRAPLGTVAVLGNHDTEHDAIRRSFAGAGIPLLENKAVKIARGGHDFWIAGLADQVPFGNRPMADLDATLAQVSDSRPVILLAHEPEIFPRVPPRVALTLSGHTHGGQVWLPFIGAPTMRGERYVYGEYIENGRHLVVSGGLGVTVAPVRFMVPPEITVVTVRSA